MAGINKVILLGRLGQNPEYKTSQSGVGYCNFSIATSARKKDGPEITQWHRCTAFNKTAELINKYVSKGQQLYVEGEIQYNQYEKEGVTTYYTNIIVNNMQFVGNKPNNSPNNNNQGYGNQDQYYNQQQQNNNNYSNNNNNQNFDPNDEVPF